MEEYMKQIEITTRVNNSLEEVDKILTKQGFSLIRKSRVEDKYLTQQKDQLTKANILTILSKCVLIRYLCVDNDYVFKGITYKNKVYDKDTVVSEEKINVKIEDTEAAEKLLNALDFQKIVDVNYDVIVYKKDFVELAFQQVEGLGLLLEYENPNNFEGVDNESILKEKQKMLDEISAYNLDITGDFDIKKSYELILERLKELC